MSKSETTRAAKAAETNMLQFNQEAFETVLEMQMSFLETATRFAQEFTAFAARRAESNAEDFAKLTEAKSPPELLQLQFDHMKDMFEDYSNETSRLIALAGDAVKEGGAAVRSSYLGGGRPAKTH